MAKKDETKAKMPEDQPAKTGAKKPEGSQTSAGTGSGAPAPKPKVKKVTEAAEYRRLMKIFKHLPPAKLSVAEGLIRQAARQRERLDNLWEDLQINGEVEMFSQSENSKPYARERPAAKNFRDTDKAYQSIIKQLCDLAPDVQIPDALDKFR